MQVRPLIRPLTRMLQSRRLRSGLLGLTGGALLLGLSTDPRWRIGGPAGPLGSGGESGGAPAPVATGGAAPPLAVPPLAASQLAATAVAGQAHTAPTPAAQVVAEHAEEGVSVAAERSATLRQPLRPSRSASGVINLAAASSGPLASRAQSPASEALLVAADPQAAPASGAAPAPAGGGLVTIESDSQQADNRTGVITAIGNVRITYPERRLVATARQAQYYAREGRLVLSGDVDVVDGDGQRIRAERLVYLLDSERLQAEPSRGRQVYTRLRLQPRGGSGAAPVLLP